MPIHPDTGIVYDEGVNNSRFAVYQNGVLINSNAAWVRLDGEPVTTGDVATGVRKYYLRTETERPPADYRFTVATTWQAVDADPAPPVGHPAGIYQQQHVATLLPAEDRKLQVDSAMAEMARSLYPDGEHPLKMLDLVGVASAKANGIPLNASEEARLTEGQALRTKTATILAWGAAIKAAIDADEDCDLDERPDLT